MVKMTKKNELEQQIEKVDAALTMLEGQMDEPETNKEKVKGFFCRFIPVSKHSKKVTDEQLLTLSYSILIVQKQFLSFVNTMSKKQCECKSYEDKGYGQYQ